MEIKKDYTVLFNAISDVTDALEKCVNILRDSQSTAEEIYISEESPPVCEAPAYDSLDCSGQFELCVPKSLHKTLAEQACQEGVSLNQYCAYLLSCGAQKP